MNRADNSKPVEILLVEDNPGDVRLTMEALKDSKLLVNVTVAGDGVEALAMLRREGPHAQVPRPDIILLDLNLPRKGGREVLAEMKQDPKIKGIPVVILTTSDADRDIAKCYEEQASCFVTKPIDLEQFFQVVKSIEGVWFTIVKLPPTATIE